MSNFISNSNSKFQYNKDFLDGLLIGILSDQNFLLKSIDLDIKQYIESQPHEWFVEFATQFYKSYKSTPSMETIQIQIEGVHDSLLKQAISSTYISILNNFENDNVEYIKDRAISFCRFQQLKKALSTSIDLLKQENMDLIYQTINATKYKGLETNFGVEYVDAFERRNTLQYLSWVETPWQPVNAALKGGLRATKLGVILAPVGCVTEDTKIQVKIFDQNQDLVMTKTITVGEVKELLNQGKLIEVKTLGGQFTQVTDYVEKGKLQTFKVKTENHQIKVSNDHLFFSMSNDWIKTRHIKVGQFILCENQKYQKILGIEFIGRRNIVDITVNHPQSCYYGNGILNHNTGKSFFLANLAAHAIKVGKKVIYATLEMTEGQIGQRIDSMLLRKTQQQLMDKSKFQYHKSLLQPYKDLLRIKEFLPKKTKFSQVENYYNQLKLFDNFDADLLVVDYGDILKPENGKGEMYADYGSNFVAMKTFAKEYKKAVWSASQGRRSSMQKDLLLGQDAAHSLQKIEIADFVISLSRKHQDKLSDTGRFVIVKNRGGKDGMVYNAVTNFDYGEFQIFDNFTKNSIEARKKMDQGDALAKQRIRQRIEAIRQQKQQTK